MLILCHLQQADTASQRVSPDFTPVSADCPAQSLLQLAFCAAVCGISWELLVIFYRSLSFNTWCQPHLLSAALNLISCMLYNPK